MLSSSSDDDSTSNLFDTYVAGVTQELAAVDTSLGDGEEAKVGDVVTVKYAGRLMSSDKQFDAGTFSFKLGDGKVIPGWDQGLQGVKVGGKRSLKIPPNLAYGPMGAGDGVIPPNADLVFDCELVSVANGPVAETMANLGIGLNTERSLWSSFS